jgi:7,8-dihydropterin-6-yl-methyl-4-(beta-D-ribofuranosyl)aminobenzene 5'-phosphate synthase
MKTQIIILVDNTVAASGIRGEHGLAFWMETAGRRLLFDTGQGLVLKDNALALRLDLGSTDTVVLSHGHYDHTGGLTSVIKQATGVVRVYMHPDALLPKYHSKAGVMRDIGISATTRGALSASHCRLTTSREPSEVVPGVWTTGEIPRQHHEESMSDVFFSDPDGRAVDPLKDDQALFVETEKGTVVLLGCAHAGLINTLDHVLRLTDGRPIRAILGGMHLGSASDERLAWTIAALRKFGVSLLAPMHCTGMKATAMLWNAFPEVCRSWCAGTVCEF